MKKLVLFMHISLDGIKSFKIQNVWNLQIAQKS